MTSALLPVVPSEKWEHAVADAMALSPAVNSAVEAMRGVKYLAPRPSMLPALVWEYGLGELTPYIPNLHDLIDQGVRWQRVRGTVSAVAIGLAWIGYSATIEEEWTGRTWWNSFQLRFPALPTQDSPDLERIEGITALSVPKRSQLRRGVHLFDVDAAQADHTRLDDTFLDFESGIAATQAGTLWSFGRCHQINHVLTEAEGHAIGNWVDPVEGDGMLWVNMAFPWVSAQFPWSENPAGLRRVVLAAWFNGRTLWLRLKAGTGAVIGYRRCRVVRAVHSQLEGAYHFGDLAYEPASGGQALYVEAMTEFDDADGVVCAEIALMVGAELADGVKTGRLWLRPGELVGGEPVAAQAISVPLRKTVRDQFKFLVRF